MAGREAAVNTNRLVINHALLSVNVESLPSWPWKSNYLQFVNENLEKPEASSSGNAIRFHIQENLHIFVG